MMRQHQAEPVLARIFTWCCGADSVILAKLGLTHLKNLYVGIGAAICITATFAGLGMYFMLSQAVGAAVATGIGVAWAAAIFNLDRLLVGSMIRRDDETEVRRLLAGLPRLGVAVLIAGAVSEPIIVRLFKADIVVQLERDALSEREGAEKRILQRQAAELKRIEDEETRIRQQLAALDTMVAEAYRETRDEADGVRGTRTRGRGDRWSEKEARWRDLLAERDEARLHSRTQIDGGRSRRAELKKERDQELAGLIEKVRQPASPPRQWAALHRLAQDPEVGTSIAIRVHLLRGLLFALELLPFWVKLLARRNAYDAAVQREEEEAVQREDSVRALQTYETRASLEVAKGFLESVARLTKSAITSAESGFAASADAGKKVMERLRVARFRLLRRAVGERGDLGHLRPRDHTGAARSHTQGQPFASAEKRGTPQREDRAKANPARSAVTRSAGYPLSVVLEWIQNALSAASSQLARLSPASRMWRSRLARTAFFVVATLAVLGVSGTVATYKYWGRPCRTGPCPISSWMEKAAAETRVLDRVGGALGVWPGYANVTVDSLPPYVEELVLTMEDKRFYQHNGVDWLAAASALWSNMRGRPRRGASTISQQCLRGLDHRNSMWPEGTWAGKFAEARTAIHLEGRYTKREVLHCWLNTVDLGWRGGIQIRGFEQGAQWWFGKSAHALSLAEAALLAGLPRGPQLYHPDRHPERARERRDLVLRKFGESHPDKAEAAGGAALEPVQIISEERVRAFSPVLGLVGSELRKGQPPKVRTTIDGILQGALDGEVRRLLADVHAGVHGPYRVSQDNPLVAGGVVMAADGRVLAYSCGRPLGFATQWDRCGSVTLNSTVKPFLLAAALDAGVIRVDDTLGGLATRLDHEEAKPTDPFLHQVCAASGSRFGWGITRLVAESDNCFAVVVHQLLPPQAIAHLDVLGLGIEAAKPATALGTASMGLFDLATLTAGIEAGGFIPGWHVLDEGPGPKRVPQALPFRPSSVIAAQRVLAGVLATGTGRRALANLPKGLAGTFAKTGTGKNGTEYLMTGAGDGVVVVLWLGHHREQRPILPTAAAGSVLGPYWARVLTAGLELARDNSRVALGALDSHPQRRSTNRAGSRKTRSSPSQSAIGGANSGLNPERR